MGTDLQNLPLCVHVKHETSPLDGLLKAKTRTLNR